MSNFTAVNIQQSVMKRLLLLFFASLALPFGALAQQQWYDKYQQVLNDSDANKLLQVIEAWQKAEPETADVYAAWFNYYYKIGVSSVLSLTTEPPADGSESLMLRNDTTQETAGYLYAVPTYNDSLMNLCFQKIDAGILKFPDRLDLPFGKIHVLLQMKDYGAALKALDAVIRRSADNHNAWLWTLDKPVDDGSAMFFDSMQDYFNQLWKVQDITYAEQLAHMLVAAYPSNIVFRSNFAGIKGAKGENGEALKLFLDIHRDAPDDEIVTGNIAQLYLNLGDKKQAKKYYQLLLKSEDETIKESADRAIRQIENGE